MIKFLFSLTTGAALGVSISGFIRGDHVSGIIALAISSGLAMLIIDDNNPK